MPLFPTIPLYRVVIDNLHLFLRVSDVLIDLLIKELKHEERIETVEKFTNWTSVNTHTFFWLSREFQAFTSTQDRPQKCSSGEP